MPELDAVDVVDLRGPEPPVVLSSEQRKALAHICRLRERGLNSRRLSWRSLLLALYIAFTLAFSVLLLNMTAFAPPGYLIPGFLIGCFLHNLKILMVFRRIWPVYEAIIDWPLAFALLKANDVPIGLSAHRKATQGVPQSEREAMAMSEQRFPAGWDAERVKRLIDYYEGMSEDEQVADDEAAFAADREGQTVITVPVELLPEIRRLLAAHQTKSA